MVPLVRGAVPRGGGERNMRTRAAIAAAAAVLLAAAGCSSGASARSANTGATTAPGPIQTTDPAADNYSYPPQATFGPGQNVTVDTSSPSPNDLVTPPALTAPEQVTYHCSGSAPDGVDITYGPNGSSHSASRLPFNHVEPLTDGALYYAVSAQLQGSGSVSCTTTVQTDNLDGSADDVSNSGSADGSFNIAAAEVCGGIDGWEKC